MSPSDLTLIWLTGLQDPSQKLSNLHVSAVSEICSVYVHMCVNVRRSCMLKWCMCGICFFMCVVYVYMYMHIYHCIYVHVCYCEVCMYMCVTHMYVSVYMWCVEYEVNGVCMRCMYMTQSLALVFSLSKLDHSPLPLGVMARHQVDLDEFWTLVHSAFPIQSMLAAGGIFWKHTCERMHLMLKTLSGPFPLRCAPAECATAGQDL